MVNNVSEISDASRRGPVIVRRRKDETPVVTIVESTPGKENFLVAYFAR